MYSPHLKGETGVSFWPQSALNLPAVKQRLFAASLEITFYLLHALLPLGICSQFATAYLRHSTASNGSSCPPNDPSVSPSALPSWYPTAEQNLHRIHLPHKTSPSIINNVVAFINPIRSDGLCTRTIFHIFFPPLSPLNPFQFFCCFFPVRADAITTRGLPNHMHKRFRCQVCCCCCCTHSWSLKPSGQRKWNSRLEKNSILYSSVFRSRRSIVDSETTTTTKKDF